MEATVKSLHKFSPLILMLTMYTPFHRTVDDIGESERKSATMPGCMELRDICQRLTVLVQNLIDSQYTLVL